MKAKYLAALLTLFIATLSVYADISPAQFPTLKNPHPSNKIDLNHTDLYSLIGSLKGIGKKRAEAIIAYRESHHGFKSLEELREVKGIGPHFMKVNHERLREVFTLQPIN